MMAITHACIATAGASLLLGTAHPLPLALAVLGSQLPDIDTTTSIIGQILYPISTWLEDRFPHRSVTHSLLATAVLGSIAVVIGIVLGDIKPYLALPLGHGLACFSDCFTRQGVQLFWPDPAWAISVSNPKRRLRTGGPAEYWVLAAAVAVLLLALWMAGAGGPQAQMSRGLGLRESAIATYNRNAATSEVYAEINGVWADDRTDASGSYLILDTQGSEFIVTDGRSLYKTGTHLIIERLNTKVGNALQRTTATLQLTEQPLVPQLQQLQLSHPGKSIYLSGTLAVDFPEDVQINENARQLQTLSVGDASITLDYHPLDLAMTQLGDQWATGTLTVLMIQLRW